MIKDRDGNKRLLHADEIECRVGQMSKSGNKYSILLYKTSNSDMGKFSCYNTSRRI